MNLYPKTHCTGQKIVMQITARVEKFSLSIFYNSGIIIFQADLCPLWYIDKTVKPGIWFKVLETVILNLVLSADVTVGFTFVYDPGETDLWKNMMSKILCQTSFKLSSYVTFGVKFVRMSC